MPGFSDYMTNKLLDHGFAGATYTPPATVYLGLSTTKGAKDGTNITAPSASEYARQAVPFAAAVNRGKTTSSMVTFPKAVTAWGTIVCLVLYDAATGGNVLAIGAPSVNKAVDVDDVPEFDASDLNLTLPWVDWP